MHEALHIAKIAAEIGGGIAVVIVVLVVVCVVGLLTSKGNPFQ